MTRRIGWVMVAGLFLVTGCGEKGSGKAGTETRNVDPFRAIEVRGVIDLDLAAGPAQRVELSGDDNLLSLVTTEVSGDRLIIGTEGSIRPDLPLVARVRVSTPVVEIVGSGASDIVARDLKGDALEVTISGAGSADLSGAVGELELDLSGAGSMDAKDVEAKKVDVDVSGAGSVKVASPEVLDVDISGAGSVEHGGDPKITKSISGAGSLKKR